MTYNVVIIGGGLAGLSLSIDLRRRGYKVVLIEKGVYPRQKVCGEYISMESHRYLYELCPALSALELPRIEKFRLTSTGSKEFNTNLGLGGFGISRFLLEDLLYQEGLKLGVEFKLNTKATNILVDLDGTHKVVTKSETLSTQVVCNSSGRRSNLETLERENRHGGTNYVGVKYHVKLPRDHKLIEIHNFRGGYCGISNIEDEKSCLCYIVNAHELTRVNKSIPELEKKVLSDNKNLKRIFKEAEFVLKEPVTISGINFRIKEPLSSDAFFLGDSAGSIAPITGNGMSMALRSAFALANELDSFFSGKMNRNELNKAYTAFWNKEFSLRIKLSRHFQKLSEQTPLTRLTINMFNSFPPLAKMTIKLTHGRPF